MDKVTIQSFINNNDNTKILISRQDNKHTTEAFCEDLWEGMLYDTPKRLWSYEVISEGFALVRQLNRLTIYMSDEEFEHIQHYLKMLKIYEINIADSKRLLNDSDDHTKQMAQADLKKWEDKLKELENYMDSVMYNIKGQKVQADITLTESEYKFLQHLIQFDSEKAKVDLTMQNEIELIVKQYIDELKREHIKAGYYTE